MSPALRRTALSLSLLLLAAGCNEAVHTLELTLTTPDGKTSTNSLSGETSWEFDNLGQPFASWPDVASWGPKVPLGLSMDFYPLQPGTYTTRGFLHLGGDFRDALGAAVTVHMDRVLWQDSASYPFRQEGHLEGTAGDGYKFSGTFTTSSDDCTDKSVGNELCGFSYPMREQVWSIGGWTVGEACPAELVKRYGGGDKLVISPSRASAGGSQELSCVTTYPNSGKSICGASEDAVTYDGCKWSVAVFAQPGSDYLSEPPRYALYSGTVGDDCPPKTCAIYPGTFTHVSGAGP